MIDNNIKERLEMIEEYYSINIEEVISSLYLNNSTIFYSIEDTYTFFNWFISMKEIIVDKTHNDTFMISEYFGNKDGVIGEGCYNIAFNYQNRFVVKIPKIDIFYIDNIQNIHEETDYYENVYGLFGEYDIREGNYDLYGIELKISDFVINNILILPNYVNLQFCFGIYDIGKEVIIENKEIYQKEPFLSLKNIDNYDLFYKLVNNQKKYENIIDQLDYKIDHILVVENKIKYCDIDINVLQGFSDFIKKLKI